ncbi:MAG TPA: ATP-binding protein [Steroidobacteraceae bacterium]|nr:ATP-binding protein [Steroidobacteraceae bacterium]
MANGGPASSDIKASEPLHGRMLHVSRLATIGEMAAGVAHELNQPLTAITNYAQACDRLLAKPDADLGDVRQALREIASQAVRAGDIIRRLRTLARGNPIERASTDINTVVTEILELLQPDARLHAARLLVELGTALPPVCVDRVQIQHVILNLARNALEAMNSSSSAVRQLQIRTARAGDADIEVCVCDSGPGLAPAALERMFDPFFSTKPDGTGLGLPISNTIARAHGGSLGYRPNEPRGACFYIRLPCAAPA